MVMNLINKSNNFLLKQLARMANKKAELDDFTYSAAIRHLRKIDKEKLPLFLKTFKSLFDSADNKEECEEACLMQAIMECDLQIKAPKKV